LQNLKGDDLVEVQALQHFATHNDIVCYLASCEKEDCGEAEEQDDYRYRKRGRWGYDYDDDMASETSSYHSITGEVETTITLKRLVDMNGTEMATNLWIAEEDFLVAEPYSDRDPTKNYYDGSSSATHWWRDTVSLGSCLADTFWCAAYRSS